MTPTACPASAGLLDLYLMYKETVYTARGVCVRICSNLMPWYAPVYNNTTVPLMVIKVFVVCATGEIFFTSLQVTIQ